MKKNDDQKEESRVVDFPIHRIELRREERQSSTNVSFALEQKKVIFSASFLSVLVIFSLTVTGGLGGKNTPSALQQRGIASLGSATSETSAWKKQWVKEMTESSVVEKDIILGKSPSLVDEMLFSELAGVYSLQMENGKIHKIIRHNANVKGEEQSRKPDSVLPLFEASSFLKRFSSLFPEFDSFKQVLDEKTKVYFYQLYSDGQPTYRVQVDLDQQGRLSLLQVTN